MQSHSGSFAADYRTNGDGALFVRFASQSIQFLRFASQFIQTDRGDSTGQ